MSEPYQQSSLPLLRTRCRSISKTQIVKPAKSKNLTDSKCSFSSTLIVYDYKNKKVDTNLSKSKISIESYSFAAKYKLLAMMSTKKKEFSLQTIEKWQPSNRSSVLTKHNMLPISFSQRKTLVLDLDETLIYCKVGIEGDFLLCDEETLSFSIRPYVKELLEYASEAFELILFTASTKKYADLVLSRLDKDQKLFKFKLYRQHCIKTSKGYIKDLSLLNRDLSNVVIVDDSACSFSLQPANGLLITPWQGDKHDTELLKLIRYLKGLQKSTNTREFLKVKFPDL